jgi:hypothetical protein
MTWTERDEILFSICNVFGKDYFEKEINQITKRFLQSKKKPEFVAVFGIYNPKNKTFYWQNDINNITYDLIKNNYMAVFGDISTVKKLCKPVVKIDNKYLTENTIPYLLDIVNAKFRVVRYVQNGLILYTLINVERPIATGFSFDKFETQMLYYREYNKLFKK